MKLITLDYFLWVATFIGHIALLAILLHRRTATKIPAFSALMLFNILRTILLFALSRNATWHAYFYTYWTLEIVDFVLELAVVYEVVQILFQRLGKIVPDAKRPMIAIGSLSVMTASGLTALASPLTRRTIEAFVFRGDLFASVLLSILFTGFLYLAVTAGMAWTPLATRIVQGLGWYTLLCFAIQGIQNYYGLSDGGEAYKACSRIQIVGYLVAQVYWVVAFSRKAALSQPIPERLRQQLEHLNSGWAALARVLESSPSK